MSEAADLQRGELGDRPLARLLDELAAPRPTPTAGSAAAWTTAMGAALVELAAGVSLAHAALAAAHGRLAAVRERAEALRGDALALGERDAAAYAPVLAALRLPHERPDRAERVAAALSAAAEPPLAIARAATEVAQLARELAGTGAPSVRGDAGAAASLAAGAADAAAGLVAINLRARPEDPRLAEARALAARAAAVRADIAR